MKNRLPLLLFSSLVLILAGAAVISGPPTLALSEGAGVGPTPDPPGDLFPGRDLEANHLGGRLISDHPQGTNWMEGELGVPAAPLSPEDFLASGNPLAVESGSSHTCALTDQGEVFCWGDNHLGQLGNGTFVNHAIPQRVKGLPGAVVSLSVSHRHSCALTGSGRVFCWGYNFHGELGNGSSQNSAWPVEVAGLSGDAAAIAAGGFHTCALTTRGGVQCWGANWHGQLGNDSDVRRLQPVDVVGLDRGVDQIATGKYHTCALILAEGIQCWGYNRYSQLGNAGNKDRWTPTPVFGQSSWHLALALGDLHTCAISPSEGVKCWGDNSAGQLGDGTTKLRDRPTQVNVLTSGVAQISAGGTHTCARTHGTGILCWGSNAVGQLGDGTNSPQLSPQYVPGMTDGITDLSAGSDNTCTRNASNQIHCWGSNSFGQVGNGDSALRLAPVPVVGLPGGMTAIGSGGLHTCALTAQGGVRCWGNNQYGQLGDGSVVNRTSPVKVFGLNSGVTGLAVGGFHNCVRTSSGGVRCWGDNDKGQLGDGTFSPSTTPVNVIGLSSGVSAVVTGFRHSCALMSGGAVQCWGSNWAGQLGIGNKTHQELPVGVIGLAGKVVGLAAGDSHTCALIQGGAVQCWGYNFNGQLGDGGQVNATVPQNVSGLPGPASALSAGVVHTCALMNSGVVRCWGSNASGQLGDGTVTQRLTPVLVSGLPSGATAVSAGGFHTCAQTSAGVHCWGDNWMGQLGDGTTYIRRTPVPVSGMLPGASAISAGPNHTCALVSGSAPRCWGSNAEGQLSDGSLPWVLQPVMVFGLPEVSLTTNHSTGEPGSFFTLTGSHYPPNQTASLIVNGHLLTPTVQTDSSGGFSVVLDTSSADEGTYNVMGQALLSAGTGFWLSQGAPSYSSVGSGVVIALPAGIGFGHRLYLPAIP